MQRKINNLAAMKVEKGPIKCKVLHRPCTLLQGVAESLAFM